MEKAQRNSGKLRKLPTSLTLMGLATVYFSFIIVIKLAAIRARTGAVKFPAKVALLNRPTGAPKRDYANKDRDRRFSSINRPQFLALIMDEKEALDFADKLTHERTGKYLNDLERQVFLGSWQGQTYEEIYPLNPQYIEKDVAYKLWKKLSTVLGQKVTKKTIRGALERAKDADRDARIGGLNQESFLENDNNLSTKPVPTPDILRVFISHRMQEPDSSLAVQLYESISAAGYKAFIASVGGRGDFIRDRDVACNVSTASGTFFQQGENWLSHIDVELKQCDYFLMLLSPQAAVSEWAIEELRQVRELRDRRENNKPVVIPIRVNCPLNSPLNHALRNYLDGLGQREWKSSADTPILLQEILSLLAGGEENQQWKLKNEESLLSSSFSLLLSPPLPVAEPELPSGQVRLASAFYVERVPYEAQCYKEILQPGTLIRIKAPRQMGKTSLMARILYHASQQGYRTVPLSFQHADTAVFSNLNQLLRWFCARISRKLRLPDRVEDYWSDTYGNKDNCTIYFEDFILPESDHPLMLGLDEVDRIFNYPHIADDFFGLLRAWYEEAGYADNDNNPWEKLRLVVVHSTEVYIPLNVNQSPFNVGLPIELPEFSQEQVQDLTQRHGLNWNATQVEQLMALVGGHPYLVRLALYHIAQQQITLEELLQMAPTEAGFYDDHLRRHLWNLQQHPELEAAFRKVVSTDSPVELDSVQAFKLHSMGLVKFEGNQVTTRFDLYRQYFRDRLSITQ